MSARDLMVDAAATFRLARLVASDTFPPVAKLREAFVDRHTKIVHDDETGGHDHVPDSWAELVECPWCNSWWIALGVVAARRIAPKQWDVVARALAFSATAGVVSALTD